MANIQDWKWATWLKPSSVSFIAIPTALMLITYNEQYISTITSAGKIGNTINSYLESQT